MFYDAVENKHGLPRDPFKALVAPRPIGWISSRSLSGTINLAPYSYFNAVADRPHIVMFSSGGRKDSVANVEETGEFVCNLATFDLREQMNRSSAGVAHGISEFELAGLTPLPGTLVKAPRVKEARVALECVYTETFRPRDKDGNQTSNHVVFGQVVGIHIDDDCLVDGFVSLERLKPLSRLGYMEYSAVTDVFSMQRPE